MLSTIVEILRTNGADSEATGAPGGEVEEDELEPALLSSGEAQPKVICSKQTIIDKTVSFFISIDSDYPTLI